MLEGYHRRVAGIPETLKGRDFTRVASWSRDELGSWEFEVTPGGESQREQAFRLGVNTVMYAMCTDYKEDQVHIPFIMKRRR